MCGIAGAFDLEGKREFSHQRLLAMTGAIAPRGPDDEQFHIEPGVAAGSQTAGDHRRERGSAADRQRGRLGLGGLQRRALRDIPSCGGSGQRALPGHSVLTPRRGSIFPMKTTGRRCLRGPGANTLCRCGIEGREDAHHLGRDRARHLPSLLRTGRWLADLGLGNQGDSGIGGGALGDPTRRGIDHFFTFFCAGTTRTCFEGVKSLPPGHYLKVRDGRLTRHCYWDLDFPDAGAERRLDDPAPLVLELEALLEQAVERRLRSDVPVVSYISGGLDSTVVLGMCNRLRGEPIPAFTIGLDRAGPDERVAASEAAAVLGSPLSTMTMDRSGLANAFPELIRAAEGPVLDTSCAALLRLAQSVHHQGFKVALTGEGADEALAGYVWYKVQAVRDALTRRVGNGPEQLFRRLLLGSVGGRGLAPTPLMAFGGAHPAQQDMYELISRVKPAFYSAGMWQKLGDHSPYDDLDLPSDRITRWHPLNQSLYVGYKVMMAGLLMIAKGDRIAMNASVETRHHPNSSTTT